ncbi:MAG: tetratricopeptide repeat protein [Sulfitobacter sp.]
MKAVTRVRAVFVGLSTVLLMSCTETAGIGQRGFESQYNTARAALEKGDYAKAGKMYARMLPESGPLNDRIQLEYAHTMLRSGQYDKAVQIANGLANNGNADARAAALSVKGTADHEIGMKLLQGGDQANGAARLKAAQQALEEVLKAHPDFDPVGSLAGRQASIAVQLKKLP